MSIFDAIILGIVEGFTEFLPVSSTGHLVLTGELLGLASTDFLKSFEIAIQLGAILAVVFIYWRKVAAQPLLMRPVLTAFLPSAVIGGIFYPYIKSFLGSPMLVVWSLALGGLVIIGFEKFYAKKSGEGRDDFAGLSSGRSLIIGLFQSISMIPGVSRAAATIIGGEVAGLSRRAAVEFSFLLAVPTMAAATALDMLKSVHGFTLDELDILLAGGIVSFFVATLAVKWLLDFVKRRNLTAFGVYRIVIALLFMLFVL